MMIYVWIWCSLVSYMSICGNVNRVEHNEPPPPGITGFLLGVSLLLGPFLFFLMLFAPNKLLNVQYDWKIRK